MTTVTQDPAFEADAAASAPARKTRPYYWSVRRELWENRSVFIAPTATAGVVLLSLLIGALNMQHHVLTMVTTLDSSRRAMAVAIPFYLAAAITMVAAFIVAFFYCLGALQGERRDRTILFWKSLPVSDLTTVLAKVTVPMVVLPLVTFVVVIALQLIMFVASLVVAPSLGQFPLLTQAVVLLYVLVCAALWHAPVWAWLLLISGWARRVTFLWAVGPPLALMVFERLAFDAHFVHDLIGYRLTGFAEAALSVRPDARGQVNIDLSQLDPIGFLLTPGLWTGLLVAAALLAAVVWQRRYRSPI